MHRTLLDTDVYSEVTRNRNAAVRTHAERYLREHGRFTISSLTVTEVVNGFERARRPDASERFLESLPEMEILDFDAEAAVIAGRIFAALETAGRKIGVIDPLIAAVAIRHDLPLATGNVQHFERICLAGFPIILANWKEPLRSK